MEYRPGCTPVQAVVCLKKALAAVDQAEHCAVLWFVEIRRRRIFRQLGYSSMNQFAEMDLGFSRTRTGDYLRLAAKLDELPALRESMAAGKVGYSKAREVIKVATPRTEEGWVELAATHSRAQLRARVRQAQEKARLRRGSNAEGAGSVADDLLFRGPTGSGADGPGVGPLRDDGDGAGVGSGSGVGVEGGVPGGSEALGEGRIFPAAVVQQDLLGPGNARPGLPRGDAPEIPVRIGVDMDPEQFARFDALMGRLQRLGRNTSGGGRAQVLLDGLAALVAAMETAMEAAMEAAMEEPTEVTADVPAGGKSNGTTTGANSSNKTRNNTSARRRAPVQIHVFQCPDCGQAAVRTSRGEIPISATTFERLACDAVIHWQAEGKPCRQGNQQTPTKESDPQDQATALPPAKTSLEATRTSKATIPPKTRDAVLARDRHRCQAPGCRHIHHLEVHHILPRSKGGTNRMDNLITLCSGCHRVWHEKGGPPPGWVRDTR